MRAERPRLDSLIVERLTCVGCVSVLWTLYAAYLAIGVGRSIDVAEGQGLTTHIVMRWTKARGR